MQRRRVASAVIAVCVAVLAGGWTYEDGMQAGSRNRASFQESLVTYGLPRLATEADFQRILARSPLEDLRDESIFDRRRG